MGTAKSQLILVLAIFPLALAGCGGAEATPAAEATAVASGSWWTAVMGRVGAATGGTLELVHDGTGWLLGKNEVTIDQVGEFEVIEGRKHATYRVTVARADESFSSQIEAVECDDLGIPTEQSQAKMDEAVRKIKAMLDRLRA